MRRSMKNHWQPLMVLPERGLKVATFPREIRGPAVKSLYVPGFGRFDPQISTQKLGKFRSNFGAKLSEIQFSKFNESPV